VKDLQEIGAASFRRRFDRLADSLPPAECESERVFLHNLLRTVADVGGRHFHDGFHGRRRPEPCEGRVLTEGMAAWSNCAAAADPRGTLREWARGFEAAFEREHPFDASRAPARPQAGVQPMDLDALAKALGCRRVELTQTFRRGFTAGRLSASCAGVSMPTNALYTEADRFPGRAGETRYAVGLRDHLATGSDLPRIVH
jgi:hypothetical protein